MTSELNGRRVAFLTANEGVEQVELTEPWQAVRDAGGVPELVAPETGLTVSVPLANTRPPADRPLIDPPTV